MGCPLAQRRGHAGYQAAAADRYDDVAQVGQLFQYLQSDGSLSRHDQFIIKRMHKQCSAFLLRSHSRRTGFIKVSAGQYYLCAIVARGLNFLGRGYLRHIDGCGDTQQIGRKGYSLGMVAG